MASKANAVSKTTRYYVHSNARFSMAQRVLPPVTVQDSTQSLSHRLPWCALLYVIIIPALSVADACLPYVVQIEHCLHEWESGAHVSANLDETTDGPRYRNHIANAIAWKGLNEGATTRILEHISSKLL